MRKKGNSVVITIYFKVSTSSLQNVTRCGNSKSRNTLICPITPHAANLGQIKQHAIHLGPITRHGKPLFHPETYLDVAQSPFSIIIKTVRRRTPFFAVTVHGAVVIKFVFIQKWKHTAIPSRIPTVCVYSTVTFL